MNHNKLNTYPRYLKYKDSGIDWIGEIPEGWEVLRLKNVFLDCTNGIWGDEPKKDATDTIVLRVTDFDYDRLKISDDNLTYRFISDSEKKRKVLKKGDLLLEKSGGGDKTLVGRVVLFDKNYDAVTSNFVAKLTPNSNIISQFINYALATLYANNINYLSIKQTTGIQNLDSNSYLNEQFCFPPLAEQQQIADFLDSKTALIDEAIGLKQQQIDKLKEYKQITIQTAVTRGLNPNAPMKNSGIDWIGEIPEHWEVSKLGQCLFPISIKNHPKLPLLSITREQGVIKRDIENLESNHNFIPDDLSSYKLIKKGQFGMNKMKAWQGSYGVSDYTGIVSPAYYIFNFIKEINGLFFHWAIRSKIYISFFGSASDGVRIGQWDLSKTRMKEIPFIIPPFAEQQQIADYLEQKSAEIDATIAHYEQQIDKLKEYKIVLIQAAVTGRIKVSNDG
ncbi:hypothetical protein QV06_07465 [Gallibacterium genomosp. 3]|uniref:Type I restriction modification DNA specificity domain-containing protein n=1 Tax=Gallibacterium genomosp. 3 TaxID=505345 RepID=A0A1A7PP04_9PAST|nr:hypothetical protein QV06_07465 [Gallibacterium genomosp. 3]